ncbi:MAG: DUF1080 domain-containing protein, partial [bacterium]|nr:DUF1080 domain-containing protein [bacterium]
CWLLRYAQRPAGLPGKPFVEQGGAPDSGGTDGDGFLFLGSLWRLGNAGFFVWVPSLPEKGLPTGIEIQILDLGYAEEWVKKHGSSPDWFTCHGDVFPCGPAQMKPFAPAAPNGSRSFPTRQTTRRFGQWNQYYIRCINGEVRLWVNGHEVSGGTGCTPAQGPIAFEAEG